MHSSHGKKRRASLTVQLFLLSFMDALPNKTAVAWSGKPEGTTASFVSLMLLYVLLLWQESCAGRAGDLMDLLGAKHSIV